MKIEAVTVCIDFSDKLEKVISNKSKLDRWIIVTHESDLDTIKLCQKNDIEFVCSKRVFDDASFAKGCAINDGLALLNKTDWLLHIDADQKLPEDFTKNVNKHCDDKQMLYGCFRKTEANRLLRHGQYTRKSIFRPNHPTKKLKTIKENLNTPIGYFQLWHSDIKKEYSEKCVNGDKDDILFMSHWTVLNKTKMIEMTTTDVSGFQGHYQGHYIGIRNLKQK